MCDQGWEKSSEMKEITIRKIWKRKKNEKKKALSFGTRLYEIMAVLGRISRKVTISLYKTKFKAIYCMPNIDPGNLDGELGIIY